MRTHAYDRAVALTEWAKDNLDLSDPGLLDLLHEEAGRRWSSLCYSEKVLKYAKMAYVRLRHGTFGG